MQILFSLALLLAGAHAMPNMDGPSDQLKRIESTYFLTVDTGPLTETESILHGLEQVLRTLSPSTVSQLDKFKRFAVVSRFPDARQMEGLYVKPSKTIYIHAHLGYAHPHKILSTIAHEVGHAFVHSRLTPGDLGKMAQELGGWNVSLASTLSFEDTVFSRPFSGPITESTFPSN